MKQPKDIKITAFGTVQQKQMLSLPFIQSCVQAGFPSPADDYIEQKLDLNQFLIKHPAATFFIRVEGESMINAGIHSGDLLIVDRALKVQSGNIVVAQLNGEFTVKRIEYTRKYVYLVPANEQFESIHVTQDMEFEVWGVVTYVIHKV